MRDCSPIDTVNQHAWRRIGTVSTYGSDPNLQLPERLILEAIGPEVRGQGILDLGVGTGRTTPHLMLLSRDYIGIDYSPEMLACCRARFPGADLQLGDARDLSKFPTGRFGLVFFSYNGIDYVGHDDRLQILRQIHRILKPQGVLAFSSHNRDTAMDGPRDLLKRGWAEHPVQVLRGLPAYLRMIVRHWRMAKHEVRTPAYAIVNDSSDDFSLLTYYIRLDDQVAQLLALRYCEVEAVSLAGRRIPVGAVDRSPWIHYIARK
ncbi:MAG: class I SAM-dependent methyltransferase [Gammaproteobacteria bacterium]